MTIQSLFSRGLYLVVPLFVGACSGAKLDGGFAAPPAPDAQPMDASPGDSAVAPTEDATTPSLGSTKPLEAGLAEASVAVATRIYANSDTTLYSMDPTTRAIAVTGQFFMGVDAALETVTDCAVDGANELYVNTELALYRATLPPLPGSTGNVHLTKVAEFQNGGRFYALAFAPPGALGPGETLVGGDGNGELWSIDPSTGDTQDLGNFGPDARTPGNVFALSGDIVFYTDENGASTGLATIRSCKKGSTSCTVTNDFLAGIDMAAIAGAYASRAPATSLLKGIYGGSASSPGDGTGFGDLFGLGAWEGSVYAFARAKSSTKDMPTAIPPRLISIDTLSGAGTVVPSDLQFADGWSGAGVTTKITIQIPPPPALAQ